jgi:hypothetical protein
MFCYGNNVPLTIASDFFHFCNASSTLFDLDTFEHYYSTYQYHMYTQHMGAYYNMTIGKFLYINGKCLDQADVVIPQPSKQDFGIAATGGENIIRSKLMLITGGVAG